ncbi:CAP-Gly domain-containing protein [Apiospora aurea]|uniref:CAP-Gly domain-containing protein n=1 Tax=Apiospora aurea TaxID=335848 RepID=A0ABR1QCY6_9PEZI
MASMAAPTTSLPTPQSRQQTLSRGSKKSAIGTASTPNLNSLYAAHSRLGPGAGALARKASFAALTPGSLAAIPDDSESYAIHSVLNSDFDHRNNNTNSNLHPPPSPRRMAPATPARGASALDHDLAVGDAVDVPGNMHGTVRFVGSVAGRKGVFAGVELHPDYAARGKNNGDVDGATTEAHLSPDPVGQLVTCRITSVQPTQHKLHAAHALGAQVQSEIQDVLGEARISRSQAAAQPCSSPGFGRTRPPKTPVPARYGTPSIGKFSASVRGTTGDPNKRLERKPSIVPRSASAMGQASSLFGGEDEATPLGRATPVGRSMNNGSIGSMSSLRMRPSSRAAAANDEEIERLRSQLDDRDRQLRDQASALAEMESSVTELTSLMEHGNFGKPRPNNLDDKDSGQLRALLREKNEKVALLTAEFDAHRADFRSTIDTLEMASTETQRVYDARIRELEQEIHEMQERGEDVDSVARQLKQLEELVQELEEGLEDARRGEAEARGEVEFLRGEVERTRTELRREREKASAASNGGPDGPDTLSLSKELEKKEDEIRGLKAIIHSLSRDNESPDKTPTQPQRTQSFDNSHHGFTEARIAREKLEREVNELRGLVETKSSREEALEHELETLRRGSASTQRTSQMTIGSADLSSYRDSKGTIIPARETRSPEQKRVPALETMPESDAYSSVTESSTLWCEICETAGHDILTCTNMFGPQQNQSQSRDQGQDQGQDHGSPKSAKPGKDAGPEEAEDLSHLNVPNAEGESMPRPLTPVRSTPATNPPPANVSILPNPTDAGPLAGKGSGVVDPEKWCALCERDGHESIDCPLEDAF